MPGGIAGILQSHKPATDKAETAAVKERVEEIVKELVPVEPKRKPGRPPKSPQEKTPPRSTSKSPSRANTPDLPPQQNKTSAESVADSIAKKAVIRQLRIYCKRFPQFAPDPREYNPHLYSAAENKLVIGAIKEAIRAEVEFLTAPALISDSIRSAEKGAMLWALNHPESPAAAPICQLHSVADAVLSDPAIDLDIGLLECEISGFMPESPFLRLLINGARVVGRVFTDNQLAAVTPQNIATAEVQAKFSEF